MNVLAKKGRSSNAHGEVTLWAHTEDVWESSKALFGRTAPTSTATAWFRFFKVPIERWSEFRKLLDLACLWHDAGKATCSFQQMLHEKIEQVIRHEYLSLLLVLEAAKSSPELKGRVYPLLHAVVGHHLKSGDNYFLGLPVHDAPIEVYSQDEGIQRILAETARVLGEDSRPTLPSQLDGARATREDTWTKVFSDSFREKADRDPNFFRALILALITSDAAGSALRRTGLPIKKWVRACFPAESLTPAELRLTIIKGRIGDIERRSGMSFQPNQLQKRARHLRARAVVVSPCGSGKTLAAFLWAEKQLETHKARRVIFLYPTRNTATEGFRDYVSWGRDGAALLHGTSDFDLEGIMFNGDEPRQGTRPSRHQANFTTDEALYALGYWNKRYISATVDSFLSFTANRYAPDCMLPLLCDSILVVDEVHALDHRMFKHLRVFLEQCDLPTLMMTATLPPKRRDIFEKLGIQVDEGGEEARVEASRPRYSIELAEDAEMTDQIESWLQSEEQRLLIVCNQVAACQEMGREVQALVDRLCPETRVLIYHSRFKLADRQRRHEQVIDEFKAPDGRLILVSTQVCQMSLDLDAQSLFTQLAPLPDLIQRMGRANRHGRYPRARVVVFPPSKIKPYDKEDLAEADNLLRSLARPADTSQYDLANLMDQAGMRDFADQQTVPLFDSLPKMESQPYRDIQEFAVDAVLDTDIPLFLELQELRSKQLAGLVVPVPRFETEPNSNSKLPKYLRVAKGEKYCSTFGYGGNDE